VLHHAPECRGDRVGHYEVPVERMRLRPPAAYGVCMVSALRAVARCCDCGAQATTWVQPPPRIEPGSVEWLWAWRHYPDLIAELLTPAERTDPKRNPLHPDAEPVWSPLTERDLLHAELRTRRS
jgi:hypothetical protein